MILWGGVLAALLFFAHVIVHRKEGVSGRRTFFALFVSPFLKLGLMLGLIMGGTYFAMVSLFGEDAMSTVSTQINQFVQAGAQNSQGLDPEQTEQLEAVVQGLSQLVNSKDLIKPTPKKRKAGVIRSANDLETEIVAGNLKNVETLLERGLDPESKDNSGIAMILLAAMNNQADIIKVLVSRGADVDTKGFLGVTPLMLAAGQGHVSTVRVLIELGADFNAKSDLGNSALSMAQMGEHEKIIEILKEAGAKGVE